MSIGGNDVDRSSGCSTNVTFDYATYTAPVNVQIRSGCSNMHLLWDHDKFNNLTSGAFEGRVNVFEGFGNGGNGIVFSNSSFIGEPAAGNCSDGFHIHDTEGLQIGPGNEFSDMRWNECGGVHTDPIEGFDSHGTVIVGNYFHNVDPGEPTPGTGSGSILSDREPGMVVKNNVIIGAEWYSVLVKGPDTQHLYAQLLREVR